MVGPADAAPDRMPTSLAQHLVRPFHEVHEVRRCDEGGVLSMKIGVANRTGP